MPDLPQRLLGCLRRKQIVRLDIEGNLGHSPFGLPVALSAQWVVIVFFRDFRADGFCATPVRRVLRVHTGPYERAYTKICAAEGCLGRCRPPRMDLESDLSLLADLKRSLKPVLINSVAPSAAEQTVLGRITGLSDAGLTLRPFDACARWLRGPASRVSVPLAELLDVQWDSHYLKTYQRHLPPLPS